MYKNEQQQSDFDESVVFSDDETKSADDQEDNSSEDEIEERRVQLREIAMKSQQRTERAIGRTLGNADIGTDLTAQSMFAIAITMYERGLPWYYSSIAMLFSAFLALSKKQHSEGPIVKSIRGSRTTLARLATQDLTAGVTAWLSIIFVVYFWHFKQYVAMSYAISITVFLNIVKHKLPVSEMSIMLRKDPDKIIDDAKTQNMRQRFS